MQYEVKSLSSVPAVKWGLEKEAEAKQSYISHMISVHNDFIFENTGLVVYKPFPFLAASPDGLAKCKCHGVNIVEIKCPYKYKHVSATDPAAMNDPTYCLNSNGLKKSHKYYCQIQTQMLVTESHKCHFVVWTPVDFVIVEIPRDELYINNILIKVKQFVKMHLIPELICKKLKYMDDESEIIGSDRLWCICRKPRFGKMISCHNDDCTIEWFHYSCVGIKRKPANAWFCPQCIQ